MKTALLACLCVLAIGAGSGPTAVAAGRHSAASSKATGAAAAAPAAIRGPDLIILSTQTVFTVNPKGCDVDEELFSGTVAVKNQGDSPAPRLAADPIVSVWIPEMLDMKDDKLNPTAIASREVFTTDVHIGKGKVKSGRGLVGKRKVYILADPLNKIAEGNEDNNLLVREMTFNCK